MTRILITGATGLIGKHAVERLIADGLEVHAIVRTIPEPLPPDVHWHVCDLLVGDVAELVARINATHLLHLAWTTEHGTFWNAPENRDWQAASERLAEAFALAGGKRIVMAGSCAEYDWTDLGDGVCRESETVLKPHTLYGQVKAEMSLWLVDFAAANGLSQAWGRVFFPYGEGEDYRRLVPSVCLALQAGEEAECSSGRQVRDFMAAEDVGWAFAALLMSGVEGAVNVASGEPHTIAEVAQMLGDVAGRPDLVKLGALPDRADDPPVLVADVARLRDEVGFTPTFGFLEGLERAYDRFRKEERD